MSTSYAESVLGTPEFMAPEMYEESYGPSVDIYSFGMCVLEMATLQTPYKECLNAAQVYKKVISGKKPACLDLIASEDVKIFILECLKDKNERATVYELLKHK
jgi:WNK lysine deficient protein kinase